MLSSGDQPSDLDRSDREALSRRPAVDHDSKDGIRSTTGPPPVGVMQQIELETAPQVWMNPPHL
jgi:hypothetical protein